MAGFTGFQKEFFEFMVKLRFNNNAEYFNTVRGEYEEFVKAPLYALCDAMEPFIHGVDARLETRPVRCVSRIRRDTRFTKDKSPYRTNMWIGWSERSVEKAAAFGFYFDISDDGYRYGAGFYGEPRAFMEKLRPMLLQTPAMFITAHKAAEDAGFKLQGEEYKRMALPEGLDLEVERFYKKKGFWYQQEGNVRDLMTAALKDELEAGFKALVPLYNIISVS